MALRPSTSPLLRCLARPKSIQSPIHHFPNAAPRYLETSTQSTTQSTTQTTPQASSQPIEASLTPKETSQTLHRLPYHVSRTPTNNLPIYSDIKAGKTLKQTRIRKITGDAQVLRRDLMKTLKLDEEQDRCEINSVTGHIVIKGWHKPRVEKFLIEKGF